VKIKVPPYSDAKTGKCLPIESKKPVAVWTKAQTFITCGRQTMQTKLAITALAVFVLTALFPPWEYTTDKDSVNGYRQGFGYVPSSQGVHSRKPTGFSFLFAPPTNPDHSEGNGVLIDFGRLFLEWTLLTAITSMVWILLVKPVWSREDNANLPQKFVPPTGNPEN
jgi:hypothetical protein